MDVIRSRVRSQNGASESYYDFHVLVTHPNLGARAK